MNKFTTGAAVLMLTATLATGPLFGQDDHDNRNQNRDNQLYQRQDDHHDQARDQGQDREQYVRHGDWKKGHHMDHDDWDRGRPIDYRHDHLRRPPRGYEWREIDGNFVLASTRTGVIAAVIADPDARRDDRR